ncbi:MAG: hypoxanthine phosphoribosyltransferase [Chloroflexi bacterium]|nr:hypoxanthine phosphoribosyltransferase [Chloroflexota bacterium]
MKPSGSLLAQQPVPALKTPLTLMLPRDAIQETVRRLASQLDRDLAGQRPLLVGVLKGSFMFMADLVRHLTMPVEVEFVRVASYGQSTRSSGKPRVLYGVRSQVRGRHVVVVEDIIDTGRTTAAVLRYLERRRPALLRVCTLLDKPVRREVPVPLHYVGCQVPDRFLVGYGLDAAEQHRQLPDIYALEEGKDGP